jgi:hypothetical protein
VKGRQPIALVGLIECIRRLESVSRIAKDVDTLFVKSFILMALSMKFYPTPIPLELLVELGVPTHAFREPQYNDRSLGAAWRIRSLGYNPPRILVIATSSVARHWAEFANTIQESPTISKSATGRGSRQAGHIQVGKQFCRM